MSNARRQISVIGAAFSAVLTTIIWASPSEAEPTPDPASATVSLQSQVAANRYWTPERLRTAAPGDSLLLGRTIDGLLSTVPVGLPQVLAGTVADDLLGLGGLLDGLGGLGGLFGGSGGLGGLLGGGQEGGEYAGGGAVVNTTGKVFFTMDGADFQCSGSSVRAGNNDLVVTAGHCVNEGPGAFATNFIFIPAFDDGAAPFGRYTARTLATTTQWRTSGDLNYDVGMALVRPVDGVDLAERVGAQGIAFNQPRGDLVHAFGYPAEAPYDGSTLATCTGLASDDTVGGTADQGIDCNMNGGSSGGPWFQDFNESTGVGFITSVNSFRYEVGLLGTSKLYGPFFGNAIQNLYNSVENR